MRRHDTLPSASLTSFKRTALPKVVAPLQHGKQLESPNGSHVVRDVVLRLCNLIHVAVFSAAHFSFIFRIMVRRRSSKSKVSGTGPRPLDKRDARINRWNTLEDIPMDEEDQCALSLLV